MSHNWMLGVVPDEQSTSRASAIRSSFKELAVDIGKVNKPNRQMPDADVAKERLRLELVEGYGCR
jgi:hypothetical protein